MKTLIAFLFLATPALAQVPKAPSQLCVDDSCAQVPPSAKYTIFDDFNSLSATTWGLELDGGANTLVTISKDQALSGLTSIKSVITRESSGDFRAQFRYKVGTPAGVSVFNKDIWFGVAVYFPHTFLVSDGRDILLEWHTYSFLEDPAESGTSPAFGLQVRNGNWQIIRRPNAGAPSTRETQQSYTTTIGPYTTGQWHRWVCRTRFHWLAGQSQCWLNGKEVYNVNGGNASNDKHAPYLLMGDYRVANKTSSLEVGAAPRVVYYDNVRLMYEGGSYEAVNP